MLWLALHLPRLALEVGPWAGPQAPPAAVLEGRAVLLVNTAAEAAGVRPGMGTGAARARCPELRLLPREPAAEAELLAQLALVAHRYTPEVVLRPQGLALEVHSSLRLFGGPVRLWRQWRRSLGVFKVSASFAAASTAEGAYLLAALACGPGQAWRTRDPNQTRRWLDHLPLAPVLDIWGLGHGTLPELLHGLGVHTLGALRRLPEAGLRRRGAAEVLERLHQAYGLAPHPEARFPLPEAFDQTLDLPEHTERLELLMQALERLLRVLEGWLCARQRSASLLELSLVHDTRLRDIHPDTQWLLALAAPEREARRLLHLLGQRLQQQALPAPVCRLRLRLRHHVLSPARSESLDMPLPPAGAGTPGAWDGRSAGGHPSPQHDRRWGLLLDHLQARLGAQRVCLMATVADHRPECATRWVTQARAEPLERPQASAAGPARPCWLLPEPQALHEQGGQPVHEGQPLTLRSRAERIEAGWFDDQLICRDYHWAEGPDHRWRWIFRVRQGQAWAWYLQGWLA